MLLFLEFEKMVVTIDAPNFWGENFQKVTLQQKEIFAQFLQNSSSIEIACLKFSELNPENFMVKSIFYGSKSDFHSQREPSCSDFL
jgi:hypothetical protein